MCSSLVNFEVLKRDWMRRPNVTKLNGPHSLVSVHPHSRGRDQQDGFFPPSANCMGDFNLWRLCCWTNRCKHYDRLFAGGLVFCNKPNSRWKISYFLSGETGATPTTGGDLWNIVRYARRTTWLMQWRLTGGNAAVLQLVTDDDHHHVGVIVAAGP